MCKGLGTQSTRDTMRHPSLGSCLLFAFRLLGLGLLVGDADAHQTPEELRLVEGEGFLRELWTA